MGTQFDRMRWATARLLFIFYITASVLTVVGGFLTAPLMTWYFFGDWRFWRHWSAGRGLLPHGLRLLRVMATDSRGFMFAVPLTSPPRSAPDPASAALRPEWPHGPSCGNCSNCCRAGGYNCPLLDEERDRCRGYNSFYWRYFNCGRFPSTAEETHYYSCGKWQVNAPAQQPDSVAPAPVTVMFTPDLRVPSNSAARTRTAEGESLRSVGGAS